MTSTAALGKFAADVAYHRLPDDVREATKRRLLDSLAVGIWASESETCEAVRRGLFSAGPTSSDGCRLLGSSTTGTAQQAALGNAVSVATAHGPTFLSPTPIPVGGSIAAVLAIADAAGAAGERTLAGLAAALEVHGELAWRAPIDGIHPATLTAVAGATGAGRTMGLEMDALADAVGLAASQVSLDVGDEPFAPVAVGTEASTAASACLLADGGVDAPDSFSAPHGWHDLLGSFDLDLDPGCERVRDAAILPYHGHPYEQTAIECAIDLANREPTDPADIDAVTVETFEAAASVIDPERIAAALVDRDLTVHPGYRADLEPIVDATTVTTDEHLEARFGRGSVPARVVVDAVDGVTTSEESTRFDGHPTTPASWGTVEEKFHALVGGTYDRDQREKLVEIVRSFEAESVTELARLLE